MTDSCGYETKARKGFIKIVLIIFLMVSGLCFFLPPPAHAAITETNDNEFPLYPAIKPNVDFWISIFTQYSKSHGVIHDINNLSIIYEVITLDSSETVSANSCNQKIKTAAIQKYREILLKLSKEIPPSSNEESRVASLFGQHATPAHFELAASNIRCQAGLSKEFKEGLIRAGSVLGEFKRIFKSHGLPADLVYLPCVESSYNFNAYSKLGAAGIWQFTHATGKMYMNIDYVVDERRDPYISTDAAARLLKKNYQVLGEWPLAITAYNHGLTGMLRAKNAAGNYEHIFKTYQGPSFKFASRNFYSEFLAARIVAKNHEKHFGNLRFQNPAAFQTVKTKGFLTVKDLMGKFSLGIEDIQALNPSLRPPVFSEQKYIPKGFNLKLPKTFSIHEIESRMAGLYKSGQKPSRFHKVRKGDTAGSIARLHSIKLNDLIRANDLSSKAAILIGQNLRIPVRGETTPAKKEPVKAKIPVQASPPPEYEPLVDPVYNSIAEPLTDVVAINPRIDMSDIKILQIEKKGDLPIGVIKVEAEETLGHYAGWLKVSPQEIRKLNAFKAKDAISIDRTIKIPLKKTTSQQFEEQRFEFHKEIEEDFFGSFSITGVETYEIKNGDNIWRLCENELEVPFWLLKKYNPDINFNSLQLKQKIKYPVIGKLK